MATLDEIRNANATPVAILKAQELQLQRHKTSWEKQQEVDYQTYVDGLYTIVTAPLLDEMGNATNQTIEVSRALTDEAATPQTLEEWVVGKPLYEAPTTDLPLDADTKSAILSAMEREFDHKLKTNTVEIRAEVKDTDGTVTTPALRLKARPADAGLIQGALGIMAAQNLTKYSWWNSPKWHELTAAELTKLLNDGVASIATLFAEFEALTKTLD